MGVIRGSHWNRPARQPQRIVDRFGRVPGDDGGSSPPPETLGALALFSSGSSVASSSSYSDVYWGPSAEIVDTHDIFPGGTTTITVPDSWAGRLAVMGGFVRFVFPGNLDPQGLATRVVVYGSDDAIKQEFDSYGQQDDRGLTARMASVSETPPVLLAEGDYIRFQVKQETGSSQTINVANFWVHLLDGSDEDASYTHLYTTDGTETYGAVYTPQTFTDSDVVADSLDLFDEATNDDRLTIPAALDGTYISFGALVEGTLLESRGVKIRFVHYDSGDNPLYIFEQGTFNNESAFSARFSTPPLAVSTGDYIELEVSGEDDTITRVSTHFWAVPAYEYVAGSFSGAFASATGSGGNSNENPDSEPSFSTEEYDVGGIFAPPSEDLVVPAAWDGAVVKMHASCWMQDGADRRPDCRIVHYNSSNVAQSRWYAGIRQGTGHAGFNGFREGAQSLGVTQVSTGDYFKVEFDSTRGRNVTQFAAWRLS